jgi:hypothetical protein
MKGARTGICIIRTTPRGDGLVIHVATIPDIENPFHETRRPFTELQIEEVLRVVRAFLTANLNH